MTGYGIIDSKENGELTLLEGGIIRTRASWTLEKRVKTIHDELIAVLNEFKPEVMVVEDLYSHYEHPITAIIMGHARGVVFLAAAEAGIPVVNYSATRIKKALTGTGRASKNQIEAMVCSTLGIKKAIKPSDVSDALACAITHARVIEGKG